MLLSFRMLTQGSRRITDVAELPEGCRTSELLKCEVTWYKIARQTTLPRDLTLLFLTKCRRHNSLSGKATNMFGATVLRQMWVISKRREVYPVSSHRHHAPRAESCYSAFTMRELRLHIQHAVVRRRHPLAHRHRLSCAWND